MTAHQKSRLSSVSVDDLTPVDALALLRRLASDPATARLLDGALSDPVSSSSPYAHLSAGHRVVSHRYSLVEHPVLIDETGRCYEGDGVLLEAGSDDDYLFCRTCDIRLDYAVFG